MIYDEAVAMASSDINFFPTGWSSARSLSLRTKDTPDLFQIKRRLDIS